MSRITRPAGFHDFTDLPEETPAVEETSAASTEEQAEESEETTAETSEEAEEAEEAEKTAEEAEEAEEEEEEVPPEPTAAQLAAADPLLRLGIAMFDCLDSYTTYNRGSTRMNLRALRLLYELSRDEEHSMSMHVLSKLLCIQRQQLSLLVTDMEYIGFIRRNRDKRDEYAIFVDLTPAGLEYLQAGACRLATKLAEATPEELEALQNACALLEPLLDPDCMTDRPRKPVFRPVR